MNFEQLSVAELKTKLVEMAKWSRERMAPLLYHLRKKLKAQGARNDRRHNNEGFGAWVEAHLPITRRTADRWADEFAISQGLKKPRTFGQKSKSKAADSILVTSGPGKICFNLSLLITEAKQDELLAAWAILGEEEATEIVCNSLIQAAKTQSAAPKDTFKLEDLGELNAVDSNSQPKSAQAARSQRLTFLEEGQAS